jgi:hypothetical protein
VGLGPDFDEFVNSYGTALLRAAFLLTGDHGHAEDNSLRWRGNRFSCHRVRPSRLATTCSSPPTEVTQPSTRPRLVRS